MNPKAKEDIPSLMQNLNDEKQRVKYVNIKRNEDESEIFEEIIEVQLDDHHYCFSCISCYNTNEIGF